MNAIKKTKSWDIQKLYKKKPSLSSPEIHEDVSELEEGSTSSYASTSSLTSVPSNESSSNSTRTVEDLMRQNEILMKQLEDQVNKRVKLQKENFRLEQLKIEHEKQIAGLQNALNQYKSRSSSPNKKRATQEALNLEKGSNEIELKGARPLSHSNKIDRKKKAMNFGTLRKSQLQNYKDKTPTIKRVRSRSSDPAVEKMEVSLFFPSNSPLKELLRDSDNLPFFISKGFAFLETFSPQEIAGFFSETVDTNELEQLIRNGSIGSWKFTDPKAVACLLIKFFNSLSESIIPSRIYEALILWLEIEEEEYKISELRNLFLYCIPRLNRAIFHHVLKFCKNASKRVHSSSSCLYITRQLSNPFSLLLFRPTKEEEEFYSPLFEKTGEDQEKNLTIIFSFIITKCDQIFLKESNVQVLEGDLYPVITASTTDFLFEKLCDELFCSFTELHFEPIVLLTHSYFTTSMKLLEYLISVFTKAQRKSGTWAHRIQQRVLNLILKWLEDYKSTLTDPLVYEKITQFLGEIENHFPEEASSGKRLLNKGKNFSRKRSNLALSGPTVVEMEIIEEDPVVLAQQLTFIDHEALRAIPEGELLHKVFLSPERSPYFSRMCESWNQKCLWVATEILKKERHSKRSQVIVQFIKIAEALYHLNNFHSCFAIIAGLSHRAIAKLDKAWEKIPKKNFQSYQTFVELFSLVGNYKKYRTALQTAPLPAIPYIALISKDLTAIEENSNFLSTDETFVNFAKMRDIWKIINQFKKYQQVRYSQIEIDTEICLYLKFPPIMPESELLSLSQK